MFKNSIYLLVFFFLSSSCTVSYLVNEPESKTMNKLPTATEIMAQGLPYDTIPDYPEKYTACNVTARLVDGLGFRYYWATEGLREVDLVYRPDSTARSADETLDHLLGLSSTIVNCVKSTPNIRPVEKRALSFEEKRQETLINLKQASNILKNSTDGDLENFKIIFQRGDKVSEFPFWHQLNGMMADALWHCGQIVSMRRASGNPFDNRANVFMGKVRER